MILEWFTLKEFYKLPVSVDKKSWRFPHFYKSYCQRKIGTFLWANLTLPFAFISRKKLCSHTFKASSEEVMVLCAEEMRAKYIKEDVWNNFFHKLTDCHLTASLRINYFSFLYKILEKLLWNSFLLYPLVAVIHTQEAVICRFSVKRYS